MSHQTNNVFDTVAENATNANDKFDNVVLGTYCLPLAGARTSKKTASSQCLMEVSVLGIVTYMIPNWGYQGYRATKSVSEITFSFL